MPLIEIREDVFNGATLVIDANIDANIDNNIDNNAVAVSADDIRLVMQSLVAANIALVWVTLAKSQSSLVPLFIDQGFVFHLCNEESLTLICRLQPNAYAPFAPTHTLGVGGLVQNDAGEVLLIRDKWMQGKGFKLPGGYVDLGESLALAAQREVMEETGIQAKFNSIVGVINKHPHAFDKSNTYIVCRLSPLSTTIQIQDTDEIEVAVWMQPTQFIHDESSSAFHRHVVATLLNRQGLQLDSFNFNDPKSNKEMYSMR